MPLLVQDYVVRELRVRLQVLELPDGGVLLFRVETSELGVVGLAEVLVAVGGQVRLNC